MVNEHGLIVECAYEKLEEKLDNYVSTPVQTEKDEYLFNAFQEFINNIRK